MAEGGIDRRTPGPAGAVQPAVISKIRLQGRPLLVTAGIVLAAAGCGPNLLYLPSLALGQMDNETVASAEKFEKAKGEARELQQKIERIEKALQEAESEAGDEQKQLTLLREQLEQLRKQKQKLIVENAQPLDVEIPDLYYTHKRKVFYRDGVWLADAPFMVKKDTEEVVVKDVRCRTIGDITCTGVTLSKANTLEEIIQEVAATRVTERGGRYDDKRSEAAMEDRKKEGYF